MWDNDFIPEGATECPSCGEQLDDSVHSSNVIMLYNEEHDVMVPADEMLLDALPINTDSALARFAAQDGYTNDLPDQDV